MPAANLKWPALETADITWRGQNQPFSRQFDDVYYSLDDGLAETRYVFLEHNRLAQRFQALPPAGAFTIAETGFGTGLNFLATAHCWRAHRPAHAWLHYCSVEKYPLSHTDLTRALGHWSDLADESSALLAHYQLALQGFHRVRLAQLGISLTLYFGDIADWLNQARMQPDAWFLDGFAPACNPQMWADDLFHAMATQAKPGTTFSTFSAVGFVRRALQQQGFNVSKVPGFGRKRDMLTGVFHG